MTFLTERAAFTFFVAGYDGRFKAREPCAINSCFISCNNTLHKLPSLIGVTCQTYDRVTDDELCVYLRFLASSMHIPFRNPNGCEQR